VMDMGKGAGHGHRFSAEGDFLDRLEGPERMAAIPRDEILPRMILGRNHTVVDLGAGTGYFSLPIAEKVRRVISIDLEPKMLDVLGQRIRLAGVPNIELLRAEATHIPLADDSMNHVLAAFVYHEVDRPARLMFESSRVLKPGGILTVLDFQKKETTIGPPVSERKTPTQVIRSAPDELHLHSMHEADVYYQIELVKRPQP
jgi:ubiquinone/menaquinone biosynthesis C-methylase UbiE